MKYKVLFEFLNDSGAWKETYLSNNESGFTHDEAEEITLQFKNPCEGSIPVRNIRIEVME